MTQTVRQQCNQQSHTSLSYSSHPSDVIHTHTLVHGHMSCFYSILYHKQENKQIKGHECKMEKCFLYFVHSVLII